MSGTGINNHFGWVKQRSAWQDIQYHRQKRAEFAAQDQANMDAMNTALSNALQNNISGASTNAAQAALKRVQSAAQDKVNANNKQIDDAQSLLESGVESCEHFDHQYLQHKLDDIDIGRSRYRRLTFRTSRALH